MQISEYLEAPTSKAPLIYEDGKAVSVADHDESYGLSDGVVIFDPSFAEADSVKGNLMQMVDLARVRDCRTAIEKLSESPEYLLNEDRCYYLELLDLKPSDAVLEIGASMGQHTRLIAKRCGHLEGLEIVPEQALFARLWCEQSGQENVNISAGGANGILPYRNDAFDVLIINYVLEWSAGRSDTHPADYHLRLLSECLRVIKPGGTIFLSTKNRYGIRLILGGVDEHSGFRFGSALPRWLASAIGRVVKNKNAAGYLHSKSELENLFKRAGFTDLQPYLLLPDARKPEMIERFDRDGLARIRRQGYWKTASRKEKLYSLLPYPVQKNIAPSHVYTATKPLPR